MLVVLTILATIAALVTVMLTDEAIDPRRDTTLISLAHARTAVLGASEQRLHGGFLADAGRMPTRVVELFARPADVPGFEPSTGIGWRGPYFATSTGNYHLDPLRGFVATYGEENDPAIIDAWGHAIVLQIPDPEGDGVTTDTDIRHARFVSAGADERLDTPIDAHLPPRSACGDDLVLYLRVADMRPE